MEDVNNTNQKFLRIFWDLSANTKSQIKAAATLVRSLDFCQDKFEKENNGTGYCPELAYSLKRVIGGTGASTHNSRVGFSIALAEVRQILTLKTHVLDTVPLFNHPTRGSLSTSSFRTRKGLKVQERDKGLQFWSDLWCTCHLAIWTLAKVTRGILVVGYIFSF